MNSKEKDQFYVNQAIGKFPFYVKEYINYYRSQKKSYSTLRGYLIDFEYFFEWMLKEGLTESNSLKNISLEELDQIKRKSVEQSFIPYIADETFNPISKKLGTSDVTVNRKISSISSLFYYLSNIAEDDKDMEPYLRRNVMAKVQHRQIKDNLPEKAKRIRSSILFGDKEIDSFRQFIADGYGHTGISKIAMRRYLENRERDLAIVSIIISNGLRIEEVEGMEVDKISLEDRMMVVRRKGGKIRTLYFSEIAKQDLADYLEIRKNRYNTPEDEKSLFVTKRNNQGVSMTKRAMQLMISKYGNAFGKITLSAHDLRHTFATRFHAKVNDIVKLREAMDHDSIQTTMIYTHVLDDELKNAINEVDSYTSDYVDEDTESVENY
ncbi:tyrosine recombinase XerS [Virgibacillus halodenitrificans]|uniref:tyrosine recombinase XerS n=1 Tax=Virgibacillus halodenitrificans TaxID=1482 RepID=UPI000EF4DAC5|nr:tyrosine recombinase XerS [Virgibacillus halodenitrificans]